MMVAVVLLFAPYIMLGEDSYIRFIDGADNSIIQLVTNGKNYKEYGFSYWQPNVIGGVDGLSQNEKFIGLNQIIFLLFQPATAYRIHVALYIVLTLSGAYFLLRREKRSLLFTGFLAILYSVLISFWNNPSSNMAYALLPWVTNLMVFLVEKNAEDGTKKMATLAMALLTGFLFTAVFMAETFDLVYMVTFILGYLFLFHDGKSGFWNKILHILFFFAGMAIPAAAIFMAVKAVVHSSHRSVPVVSDDPTLFYRLSTLTAQPDIFHSVGLIIKQIYWFVVGIVKYTAGMLTEFPKIIAINRPPVGDNFLNALSWSLAWCLFLATTGWIIQLFRHARYYRNTLDIAFLLLPVVLAGSKFFIESLFPLDILKMLRYWRFTQLFPLTMLLFLSRYLLSTVGVHSSSTIHKWYGFSVRGSFALVLLLTLAGTVSWYVLSAQLTFLTGSQKEYLDQPDLRRVSHSLTNRETMPFRAAMVNEKNYFPSLLNSHGLETIDGYTSIISKRFLDYWRTMNSRVVAQRGLFPSGNHKLYLRLLPETVQEGGYYRMGDSINVNLLRLANVHYIFSPVFLEDPDLVFLESMQVRKPVEAFGFWSQFGSEKVRIDRLSPLHLYQITDPFPRHFGVFSRKNFETEGDLLKDLGNSSPEMLRSKAFTLGSDTGTSLGETSENEKAEVQVLSYSTDRITLKVNFSSPGILVSIINYSPFWTVRIDGHSRQTFPVYHTFIGSMIPQGIHEVTLSYAPPYREFFYLRLIHFFFSPFSD